MNNPRLGDESAEPTRRSLLQRLTAFLVRTPESREQLLELLRQSHESSLLDADALSMIEGVMQVSELAARDIMVPRAQMDVIDIEQSADQFVPFVIRTGHSRFPVIEGERDNVLGILHSKDLLKLYGPEPADVRDLLRPAVFIPESKRLNVLLRDFRINRNHVAIVVDEYGGVAGLITIEDVLEQIVGDIEDEFDFDEQSDHIVAVATDDGLPKWRVKALTELEHMNETLGTQFAHEDLETIGGLVTEQFGRVPRRGEKVRLQSFEFEVLRVDGRQIQLLLARQLPADDTPSIERSIAG
jgi:magnesium and cobalt transporter